MRLDLLRSHSRGPTAILAAACALALVLAQPESKGASKRSAAKTSKSSGKHETSTDYIFTNRELLRIDIQIPEEGMQILRESPRGASGSSEQRRPQAKATVRDGTNVYHNVAVHLKGAAGSFRDVDDRPGLTLNFDKHVKGQTFRGVERFSLNNSVQDRSLLNEQISREMFAAAGVPVPRATHAIVQLNGRDLGIYVLTEAFNKQFLARHFKDPKGNLYDGGFLRDVTDDLEKSSGPTPEDRSDLRRLAEAAREANTTNRLARLKEILDVERFLSYLALDVMLCDWDGYALNRNNYRIYHDPTTDKLVFMPHGLDQMFGIIRAGPDMPLFPRMRGLVARAVLQTPEGRQRYRERIWQLSTNIYHVEALTNRVWTLAERLKPALEEQGPAVLRSHQQNVTAFCDRIVHRARSIHQQLTNQVSTLRFDPPGMAKLPAWRARTESGQPLLDETTEAGKRLLHISTQNKSSVGVWFVRVRLEPGQYRLQGRVRTEAVRPDPGDRRGGALLRTRDRRAVQKLTGEHGWTDVTLEFEVQDAPMDFGFMGPIQEEVPEVELLCELRAAKGEAWFDRDSLRLFRR